MADPIEGVAALEDATAMSIDFGPAGVVPDSARRDPRRAEDAAGERPQERRWPHFLRL